MSITVRAPAKINLSLEVGPLRPDGFHDLTTVYSAISLYDELTAEPADDLSIEVAGEGAALLTRAEENLALRAARLLAAHAGVSARARLSLRKEIPVAAGLAGGSADAAAALVACNHLWRIGLSQGELLWLAAELGSDIPFAVLGGAALGTGRGEQVSAVETAARYHWVVGVAAGQLSTPSVFRQLDLLRERGEARAEETPVSGSGARVVADLTAEVAPAQLARGLGNDLQVAAISLRPALALARASGLEAGALAALISGSGPTVVFLAQDAPDAVRLAEALDATGQFRWTRTAFGPVPGAG